MWYQGNRENEQSKHWDVDAQRAYKLFYCNSATIILMSSKEEC